MGFLTKSSPASKPELRRLPSGTFTIDAECRIVSSTVPHWVSETQVRDIGREVLAIFQSARNANLPFTELNVQYPVFKITAREMRGGAIIFLSARAPQTAATP